MSLGCRSLSDHEASLILSHLSERDAALFNLGLKTGFRISELLSISVSELLERDGSLKTSLTVARKSMKGKQSGRSVPLNRDTRIMLSEYIAGLPKNQKYLFQSQKGSRLSRHQAWRGIKEAADTLGLKGKIACHSARKSLASKAYEASGKDLALVQRILGHRSVNSTISYLAIEPENLKQVWEAIQTNGKE